MNPSERKRKEAEVKEWEERWTSVKNWLRKPPEEKPYTLGTKNLYIKYMRIFCELTGKNPDQIANCEDIGKIRDTIAAGLKKQAFRTVTIMYRIHALNSFWAAKEET